MLVYHMVRPHFSSNFFPMKGALNSVRASLLSSRPAIMLSQESNRESNTASAYSSAYFLFSMYFRRSSNLFFEKPACTFSQAFSLSSSISILGFLWRTGCRYDLRQATVVCAFGGMVGVCHVFRVAGEWVHVVSTPLGSTWSRRGSWVGQGRNPAGVGAGGL
jgi:hypothetical protein